MKIIFSFLLVCFTLLCAACNSNKENSADSVSTESDKPIKADNSSSNEDRITHVNHSTGDTISLITHTPLHPQNSASINFLIKANSALGIKKVIISIYEYKISEGVRNTRVIERRQGGLWGKVDSLQYTNKHKVEAKFVYKQGFQANTYIKYSVEIVNKDDHKTVRTIRMQAGTSPFGDREILLYSTSDDNPSHTYDLCFVPSTFSYSKKIEKFRKDLETILYEGYLPNNMVRNNTEDWAFYYTPKTASVTEGTTPPVPSFLVNSSLDYYAFIHRNPFQDQASLNRFSTEYDNRGTVMHETGHAVFDLSDEYDGSSSAHKSCNVFISAADCKAVNGGKECRKFHRVNGIIKKARYSPDPTTPNCVMNDDGNTIAQNYGKKCAQCISAEYAELNSNKDKKKPDYPSSDPTLQADKILIIKLTNNAAGWKAEILDATYGTPSLARGGEKDFAVTLISQDKKALGTWSINDPRIGYVDEGPKNSRLVIEKVGEHILRVPYDPSIATIQIAGTSAEANKQLVQVDVQSAIAKAKF